MSDNDSSYGCGCAMLIACLMLGLFIESCNGGGNSSREVDDILAAKSYVRSQLNYPDTADFHDMSTKVTSSHVYLKVTAENGFGVPTTQEFKVPRERMTQ